jgi:endo-1,4-beta-xylanase
LEKFVGNITTGNGVDTDGKTFSKHWNQITPENAGKWGSVQGSASGSYNWGTLDAIYKYCETNNVIFKEHTFIWGAQQPSGSISETQVKAWMTAFCTRYPNTRLIDVVNEPPPHTTPSYANNIGGGTNGNWQWITNAFKWAREACPNAILILNDYNNIEWSADNTRFINIVKAIKTAGAPIDAVGAQAHDLDHASVSTATMKSLIAKLNSETGLPVHITEYDISTTDDTAQLNKFKEHIPFFMSTDYIKGVTIWGWIYGKTWSQAPQSGLIRNGTARPAMTWLMQELGRPAP